MKKIKVVKIPVGVVLETMAKLHKAKASTRSRGIRRELSSIAKRLEIHVVSQVGDKVAIPWTQWLKTIRSLALLVQWGKKIGNLVHAIIVE